DRHVSVKGLAERDVKADLAVWSLGFVASGNELSSVQDTIKKEAETVGNFLRDQGISADETTLQNLDVTDREAELYSSSEKGDRYIISQTLLVRSQNVDKVASASQHVGDLVDKGVILTHKYNSGGPSFLFTKL